ncbi:MAG TPA: type II secretion system protein [Chthoniobacteraceae bacterium]|jgi:prepilin-type N-terminal cleavage/methylation domain-containing protein
MKHYIRREAFTLIELLVVMGIIALLAAITLPVVNGVKRRGLVASETSAARQVMVAYAAYAADNDGALLPGYGDFPAQDDAGKELHSPVSSRYPWRLAPYLSYDLRILYGKTGDARLVKDRQLEPEAYAYAVSVSPSFGLNTVFVGGDYKTLNPDNPRATKAYGSFCVRRLSETAHSSRLIVFASAGYESNGAKVPGYFKVEAPTGTGRRWPKKYDASEGAAAYGHVDFRFEDRALAAMLDGHIELLDFTQMDDMRRWSSQAAEADEPTWVLGQPSDS